MLLGYLQVLSFESRSLSNPLSQNSYAEGLWEQSHFGINGSAKC